MSRQSVRDATALFLSTPPITAGAGPRPAALQVYAAVPFFAKGANRVRSGAPSGAIVYPVVTAEHETQDIFAGSSAFGKRVLYTVTLCLRFVSNAREPATQYQDDHDALVQAIKTRIRSDSTFGGRLFAAGEGTGVGSEDLHVLSDIPVEDEGLVAIWTTIEFTAIEFVLTPGG